MTEFWYRLTKLPDLTLNEYASLGGDGVSGVLEKHIAFLRQLNRSGIVSGLSFHLFYLYVNPAETEKDTPGRRLRIHLLVRGEKDRMQNVPSLIGASALADYFALESEIKESPTGKSDCSIANALKAAGLEVPAFKACAVLTKSETLLPTGNGMGEPYYLLRDWEMEEDARLYNMCKMMEALNRTVLYRVDLYPVEKTAALRDDLRKPMLILRRRQSESIGAAARDHDGADVLENYEKLLEKFDTSPHFTVNVTVFAENREDALSVLDAAGAESLKKGKYSTASFAGEFHPCSFLEDAPARPMESLAEKMTLKKGARGLTVCRSDCANHSLNYLPSLFTLEEAAPFFRFPALHPGEVIQLPRETDPEPVGKEGALFLGRDKNGYDVFVRLSLLTRHAFVAGVPGSGKTNTMHHLTSTLWKEHKIPFLVFEPAKQEYRALANDPAMKDMYLFSPNADMSFPLHINPFEMPEGTEISEHISRLMTVFDGAFTLEPPMPFLLDTAIEAVYRECGWMPYHVFHRSELSEDGENGKRLPTMSMLYARLEKEVRATDYGAENKGNLESALKVRIGSLLRREMGDVFDVPESTFPPEKWLTVPAVIELEAMGPGPANFLTLMLCSLIRETLKINPRYDGPVRHVIFIEEAHNLIGPQSEKVPGTNADPKQAATAFIVKMLAEVRAFKEGIVIADQLPTAMAPEVLKNTGLKISLQITASDDRSVMGSTMAADSVQIEQMAVFRVGEALIFHEGRRKASQMRVHEWWGELEDKAQKKAMVTPKDDDALRTALSASPAYKDANRRSIQIIYKMYLRRFLSRIAPSENWMEALAEADAQIQSNVRLLEAAARGESSLSEEEQERCEEQLLELTELKEDALCDSKKRNEAANLIQTLGEWVFALEWMKGENGRWRRFGASGKDLIPFSVLQSEMCEHARQLFMLLAEPKLGDSAETKADAVIDRLNDFSVKLDLALAAFYDGNGTPPQ